MKSDTMRFTLRILAAWALFFGSAAAGGTSLEPPEFEEDWYVVTMQDQPCGYMHSIFKRVGKEVHSQTNTKIEIRRGPTIVKMVMDQTHRETLDGKPLGFKYVLSMGAVPETSVGTVEGDVIALTTEQYGVKKTKRYPFDPEIRFGWGQMLAQRERGLAPGTTFTLKTYDSTLKTDGPIDVEFKVHGKESIEVLGRKKRLHRVTASMKLEQAPMGMPGAEGGMTIDSDVWLEDDLKPIVTTVNMGFLKMRMYKTTKADALKGGAPPEMFLETLVRTKERIGPDANMVKLKLSLKDGVKFRLPDLPNTDMQTFKRINDREAVVTIRRNDWDDAREVEKMEQDPALQEFLQASAVCDAKDRKVRRLARKAVRGKKTPAEKADALRKFVGGHIIHKGMDVGFATASEVARNQSGDCSEHGVLLAALARAAGLPARGVTGIVEVPPGPFSPAKESAFGYHMWTQVYIGGQWLDLDAALRQTDCDPTHIAISLMPLNDEGMINSITSMIPLLGQLEIEILKVEP
ncbi:MAG: transglutaminase family protein [Phycisphaerales bacterium]|nr:transglutaminase family protein [Phycisphaerales bacterium]